MSDQVATDAAAIENNFLDRIAGAMPGPAKGVDLAALARWLAEQVEGRCPDVPHLRRAADAVISLSSKRWPSNSVFVEALTQQPGTRPRSAEVHWKPGLKPPHATDQQWAQAYERQQQAARRFVRQDLEARELGLKACREDWANAYWFWLIEHGRLPSPDEQRRLINITRENERDLENMDGRLGARAASLRSLHDEMQTRARKELGCP
jgi:hypothetical protein